MLGCFDGHGSSCRIDRHAAAVSAATEAPHDLDTKVAKKGLERQHILVSNRRS
jgi:hypothetical protein